MELTSPRAVALRFGNCNNGTNDGGRYLNVNNTATNANWNIGAALFYPIWNNNKKSVPFLHPCALKHA